MNVGDEFVLRYSLTCDRLDRVGRQPSYHALTPGKMIQIVWLPGERAAFKVARVAPSGRVYWHGFYRANRSALEAAV